MAHGYIADKDEYLKRLRRIEGQIRGLQRMVESETYCIDVLTQISAVQAALDKVALGLMDDHARHCVVDGPADVVRRRDERDHRRRLPRGRFRHRARRPL